MKLTPRLGADAKINAAKTLAVVIAAVDLIAQLSPGRRGDLKTACRRIAHVLSRPPEGIPVDLAMLREALEQILPAHYGMTAKRWSSIRSDFLGALRLTGFAQPLATSKAVLTVSWDGFLATVASKAHRTSLSRFAGFCSLTGVEPDQVTDEVLQRFAAALTGSTLVRKPGQILRMTAQCWNGARGEGAGAVGSMLTVRSNRPPLQRIPLSAMPESFRHDLDAWRGSLEARDPFAPGTRDKPLRAITIFGYQDKIISAFTAAVKSGVAVEAITSLKCMVEPEVFKAILRHRHAKAGGKPSPQAQSIATILLIVAKTWCGVPGEQVDTLKALRAKLPALKQGMTEKNRHLLQEFEDPRQFVRLLALPDKLWRKAESGKLNPGRSLVAAQLSLLIDILTVVPLRAKNITALNFTNYLSWPRGAKGPALLLVPGADMKTGQDYQAELPPETARRLLIYRDKLAPSILGHRPEHLFVTARGKPKVQQTLAVEFKAIVARELGIVMTLHQVRHLAAKVILDAHPEAYPLVQQLLGHKNLKTTLSAYAGVDTRRASRSYTAIIANMKSTPIARAAGIRRKKR